MGLLVNAENEWLFLFQFSRSVMSDSLRHHELQHTRPPCPSPTPGVYPNPCPLSQRCHQTISSSVVPFSSSPQSFPASGSFPMSHLFVSGGQSIEASAFFLSLSCSLSTYPMLHTNSWLSTPLISFTYFKTLYKCNQPIHTLLYLVFLLSIIFVSHL